MKFILICSGLFLNLSIFSQVAMSITMLEPLLNETSGLLFTNQKIITLTDSDNEAALYEIDSLSGNITRKVVIANASNVDWEDLAMDTDYLYIGDFGNNDGNRTNLKIYKASLNDYWNTTNDTIYADTIRFNFADQTNFSPQPYATNFDCEAMAVIDDSIYLFTKNWVNHKTTVYRLPKLMGDYSLLPLDSLPVQGIITSADFNSYSNRLVLTGNTPFNPFLVTVDWNSNVPISNMPFHRNAFDAPHSIQVESIATISETEYYLTAESFSGSPSELLRLNTTNMWLSIENQMKQTLSFYPNPTKDFLYFTNNESFKKEFFNSKGQWITSTFENKIDMQNWENGIYFVKTTSKEGVSIEKFCISK